MAAVVMFIYSRQAGDIVKKRGLTGVSVPAETNQEEHQEGNNHDYQGQDDIDRRGQALL